ncbi:hypothetical protein [Streptomyces sp. CC219B]|uniref:hypothetical protein n=1 Tax=Streptomyces sp. CC219B TaxID=3044574 RepID=UPI0024A7F8AA|nr:hypothetical protein [Streptomyces sp. CC219B]
MRHQKQNCAPHFAEIEVDFEPAAEGFVFEVAPGLTVNYEPAEDLPRFFSAVAQGIEEQLSPRGHEAVIATRVVLRDCRAETFGSHELAFRIAGCVAARTAWERAFPAAGGPAPSAAGPTTDGVRRGSSRARGADVLPLPHPDARAAGVSSTDPAQSDVRGRRGRR